MSGKEPKSSTITLPSTSDTSATKQDSDLAAVKDKCPVEEFLRRAKASGVRIQDQDGWEIVYKEFVTKDIDRYLDDKDVREWDSLEELDDLETVEGVEVL